MNPDIFSITPRIGVLTFSNISAPFRTSERAISCGVVTIIAPDIRNFCVRVSWTSPVPGGKSKIKKSRSPQSTSLKNCSVILETSGPLQMTGVSLPLIKPKLIIFIPYLSNGTNLLSSVISGCWLTPSIIGNDGP